MKSALPLRISVVPSRALARRQRKELLALCSRAYGEDFSAYMALLDPAVHLLAHLDGELVSHAAWVERELRAASLGPLRTAYVEAVATLPEHQGRGHARTLLSRIPGLVGDYDLAALSPSADDYYRRLGWETWEGPLSCIDPSGQEVSTPEDQVMIHRLPLTPPALDLRDRLSVDWRPIEVW